MSLQEVCLKSSNKSANIEYFWFLWDLAELSRMIKTGNSRKKYSSAKVSVDLEKRSIWCFWRRVDVMSVDGLLFSALIPEWKKLGLSVWDMWVQLLIYHKTRICRRERTPPLANLTIPREQGIKSNEKGQRRQREKKKFIILKIRRRTLVVM